MCRERQNVMVKEITLHLHINISARKPFATHNFPSGNSWTSKLKKNTVASFHILPNFLFANNSKI
jgi:hypothetical protein